MLIFDNRESPTASLGPTFLRATLMLEHPPSVRDRPRRAPRFLFTRMHGVPPRRGKLPRVSGSTGRPRPSATDPLGRRSWTCRLGRRAHQRQLSTETPGTPSPQLGNAPRLVPADPASRQNDPCGGQAQPSRRGVMRPSQLRAARAPVRALRPGARRRALAALVLPPNLLSMLPTVPRCGPRLSTQSCACRPSRSR